MPAELESERVQRSGLATAGGWGRVQELVEALREAKGPVLELD